MGRSQQKTIMLDVRSTGLREMGKGKAKRHRHKGMARFSTFELEGWCFPSQKTGGDAGQVGM